MTTMNGWAGRFAPARDLSLKKATMVVLLAAIVLIGVLMVFQWRSLRSAQARSEDALAFIDASRALMTQIVNAETGARGFLITLQPGFLAPFDLAAKAVPSIFARLDEMAADAPGQIGRLRGIEETWRERRAKLAGVISLAREGRVEDARGAVRDGGGDILMGRLRAGIDALVDEEQRTLSKLLASIDSDEAATRAMVIAAFAIAVGSLLAALAAATGDARKLENLVTAERRAALAREDAHVQLATAAAETQTRLRNTSRLLAAAVANAPIMIWSQDRSLVYRWFSGGPLGLDPEKVVGRTDRDILPEDIRATVASNSAATLQSGKPRSYELCYRRRRGERWYEVHVEPTHDADGAPDGLTGVAVEITDRKKREQNNRLLLREISHRSKNILAVVQAMARQTAMTTSDPAAFVERFAARLEALGATHALLVNDGWTGADLRDLIRSQIGPLHDQSERQIFLSGPPLRLPPDISQNIGLALHELATNAAKYGALSDPAGRVDIVWTAGPVAQDGRPVELSWKESGGPRVEPPQRKGFGQVVIERMVSRALDGAVDIRYDPEGLSWRLRFSLRQSGGGRAE